MVRLLRKNFDIPGDLDKYLQIYAFFEDMRENLSSLAMHKIKISELNLLEDEDMIPAFRDSIKKVIEKLCNDGVYDKTIDEYLASNEGYRLFSTANKLALEQFRHFLQEHMIAFRNGWEAAESKASSSITGSGVTVFSSSFLTLAASAAYDYSCAKKQFDAANEQYKIDIASISNRLDMVKKNNEVKYINDIYIPSIGHSISAFSFSAMDKYISDLINADKFDASTLNYVNFKRSNGILENLTISNNAESIIESAYRESILSE